MHYREKKIQLIAENAKYTMMNNEMLMRVCTTFSVHVKCNDASLKKRSYREMLSRQMDRAGT